MPSEAAQLREDYQYGYRIRIADSAGESFVKHIAIGARERAVRWTRVMEGALKDSLYFEFADGSLLIDHPDHETRARSAWVIRSKADKQAALDCLDGPPTPWPELRERRVRMTPDEMHEVELLCAVQHIAHHFGWFYRSAPYSGLDKVTNGRGGGYEGGRRHEYKLPPGFPDMTLIRTADGHRISVELKSQRGHMEASQKALHAQWAAAGNPVIVWRPSHWPDIMVVLSGDTKAVHQFDCPCKLCERALSRIEYSQEWSDGTEQPVKSHVAGTIWQGYQMLNDGRDVDFVFHAA